MKQEKPTRILKALAMLLPCFSLPLGAATTEEFIQGYASAVLEREFHIRKFSLTVARETVRIKSAKIAAPITTRSWLLYYPFRESSKSQSRMAKALL
jgi:hypothetical protein